MGHMYPFTDEQVSSHLYRSKAMIKLVCQGCKEQFEGETFEVANQNVLTHIQNTHKDLAGLIQAGLQQIFVSLKAIKDIRKDVAGKTGYSIPGGVDELVPSTNEQGSQEDKT